MPSTTLSEPNFREAIAEYIRAQAKPPDKFSHQPRLYHLAKQLAEGQPFDDDVLHAASWMHDRACLPVTGRRPGGAGGLGPCGLCEEGSAGPPAGVWIPGGENSRGHRGHPHPFAVRRADLLRGEVDAGRGHSGATGSHWHLARRQQSGTRHPIRGLLRRPASPAEEPGAIAGKAGSCLPPATSPSRA